MFVCLSVTGLQLQLLIVYVPFVTSGCHHAMEIEVEDSEGRRRRHAE